MKKTSWAVILLLTLCFSLTGCGAKETQGAVSESRDNVMAKSLLTAGSEAGPRVDDHGTEASTKDGQMPTLETEMAASPDESGSADILIAYFSRADENYNVGFIEKGNTAILAEMVADITGGDLFEISTVDSYPVSYDECLDVAKQEQKDNARPELATHVEDLDKYSVCFLCYPIWWSDLPMAVYSFLDEYDWDGKTIITLNTHEGSGKAGTPDKISKYLPNATVIDGLAIQGQTVQNMQEEARDTIEKWLNNISKHEMT